MFFIEQGSSAYTVNLPKLSTEICGWQAKFCLSKLGSGTDTVAVVTFGSAVDGGLGPDQETVNFLEMTHDGVVLNADCEGFEFDHNAATVGTLVEIHTDGTTWFVLGIGDISSDIARVG